MREKLEIQKMDYQAILQEQEKDNVNDKIHLQKTIETLRSKLEKENA